jgi:hypothetical protein
MMRYLESHCGISLARCFDLGISEAMRRVGEEWASGTRSIAQEHRFTQKVVDAVYGLRNPEASAPKAKAPLALVGCAEGSFHEAGALFVRVLLEEAGWQVCYLGGNVPFTEYASIQADLKAKLVAISFVPPCSNPEARRGLGILAGQYREDAPYYLALGGSGLDAQTLQSKGLPFLSLKIERDTESFQAWARSKARERNKNADKLKGAA